MLTHPRGWRTRSNFRPIVRAFDLTLLILSIPILLPVVMITAVALRIAEGPPVLYRASRLGASGQEFTLFKFRTMRPSTHGPRLTQADDPRVTPLGKRLRATKIDELPQVINVFRGDMDLIGPRPEDPKYRSYMTNCLVVQGICLPGITSPASIAFRNEDQLNVGDASEVERRYIDEILPKKQQLERHYLFRAAPWDDLLLLARTLLIR